MLQWRYIGSFILFFLLTSYGVSQTTVVEGVLKDEETQSPIKYAHLLFQNTNVGTTTDEDGYFKLSIKSDKLVSDTLVFSSLGYKVKRVRVSIGNKQNIEVLMTPSFFQLQEFDVLPGENPSWEIMRRIIANKDKHNPEKLKSYSSREYAKTRFDLNHFTDNIKKSLFFRPFDYIWENTQVTEDGISYLPVLLIETSVDHYSQSSPNKKRDIIRGKNTSGLAGKNLLEFVEDMAIAPNVYNNFVVILDKNFPSPINDNYKSNYKFYITDSSSTEEGKAYHIIFKPKHKGELGFDGEMRVDSGSYAITEISLRFDIRANVNFVRSYFIKQKYEQVAGGQYMLSESMVLGDFTVMENMSELTGFFGRKHSTFVDYRINTAIEDSIFKGPEERVYNESYQDQDSTFWEDTRLSEFTQEDEALFDMVEKVESDPAFILRKNIIKGVISGYVPFKGLEIGNLYTFYSWNEVEKSRVKFGFRIDQESNTPVDLSLYGAYGFYDEEWKYGIASQWHIGKEKSKEQRIGFDYRYDISQLGRSFNNIALDHIITSIVNIETSESKFYVRDFNFHFEKNISTGLSARINYFNSRTTPVNDRSFIEEEGDDLKLVNNYFVSGIDLTFKFSYLYEDIVGRFYDKKDVANRFRRYPDIAVKYSYSDQDLFQSDFDYQKLKINLHQQVRTKKLGYFSYNVEAGKTFGTVAYPYLDIPFGNQQVLLDKMALNLMGFAEYVTDQYLYVQLAQHFDGLILDRVPLIRMLKWRSFIFAKGYFGSLRDENNNAAFKFPEETQALTSPYYEVGFGIENIFKISSIDFIWRITDNPVAKPRYYFMVKPSFTFTF